MNICSRILSLQYNILFRLSAGIAVGKTCGCKVTGSSLHETRYCQKLVQYS